MPFYSHLQPCADYFNSSLMIQNFTLSNVTNGNNHVIFHDERPPTCTWKSLDPRRTVEGTCNGLATNETPAR
jgi:hypothetical protein